MYQFVYHLGITWLSTSNWMGTISAMNLLPFILPNEHDDLFGGNILCFLNNVIFIYAESMLLQPIVCANVFANRKITTVSFTVFPCVLSTPCKYNVFSHQFHLNSDVSYTTPFIDIAGLEIIKSHFLRLTVRHSLTHPHHKSNKSIHVGRPKHHDAQINSRKGTPNWCLPFPSHGKQK